MHHLDTNIVIAELLYGARLSAKSERNLKKLEEFALLIGVAPFDRASAEAYARLRLALRTKGRPTGEVDALIAAVALAHQAVFVTHNTRHFESIESLQIEDWL